MGDIISAILLMLGYPQDPPAAPANDGIMNTDVGGVPSTPPVVSE